MSIFLSSGSRSVCLRATRNIIGISHHKHTFIPSQERTASSKTETKTKTKTRAKTGTKSKSKDDSDKAVRSLGALDAGEHYDTTTYAAHAQRTGLDTSSTVYLGTHYEYKVASSLGDFGFDLKRVGGRGDFGIDLIGTWVIPSSRRPLRVIMQCKVAATKTMIGPRLIRELEGAFIGAPSGWRGEGVVGLLVAQKPATKGVRDSLGRSRWPMGFISCLPDGKVQQMLWNRQAEDQGLAGLGVAIRFSEGENNTQELILTYQGKPSTP
ncbi:hypothetical protein PG984_009370 [Apiospora sp. TS-2023a]